MSNTEDIQARLEIARLHEVVRHLAFLVNIVAGFTELPANAKDEIQKQLGLMASTGENK